MPCSLLLKAKRAFVKVLLVLASAYSVVVQVNRDPEDKAVLGGPNHSWEAGLKSTLWCDKSSCKIDGPLKAYKTRLECEGVRQKGA